MRAVRRYVLGAAAVGLLNALLVLAILAAIRETEQRLAAEYTYGFFSYAPLSDYESPSRFPWEYVVPPVVVAVVNGLIAAVLLRRSRSST